MSDFIIKNGILTEYVGKDENLIIPEGVTKIDSWVLSGQRFRNVVLSNTVTEIDFGTFENGYMESITIPASVQRINSGAFRSTFGPKKLVVSGNWNCTDASAFEALSQLEEIALLDEGEMLEIVDGVLYNKQDKILLLCPRTREEAVTVQEGTRRIGNAAFCGCKNLIGITLPQSLEEIGESAFAGCGKVNALSIPAGVQKIGKYSFAGCKELKTLENNCSVPLIKNTMRYWDTTPLPPIQEGFLPGEDFGNLKTDERVVALNAYLHSAARYGAEEQAVYDAYISRYHKKLITTAVENGRPAQVVFLLQKKKLPLKELDIVIEAATKKESEETVAILLNYKDQTYSQKDKEKEADRKLEEAFKPHSEELAKQEWKFAKNNALGGYKIMGYLGESPYVQIPEQIGDLKVVSISPNAFAGNEILESVVIPDTVVQIGAGAFCDCKKLQSVTLPKDLTLLDKKVFQGTAIQEITLPASIQKIASSALGDQLQRIELAGESKTFTAVDGILYNKKVTAFACVPQGRISITIPETIKGLKELDFAYVPSLTDVYIPASVAVLGDQWIFYEDGYDVTIHAPAGSQWEEYAKNHKTKFQAI